MKVFVANSKIAAVTDENGVAKLVGIPDGKQIIIISVSSHKRIEREVVFPIIQLAPEIIQLTSLGIELEEVRVQATRANKTMDNLPTRTEVLTSEIDEAALMEPCKIAHLITHSTGIQVQTTSATSGGAVARIQGLNGRYTQILKDGFPLYGGISGNLDIMQIPPLDLKQVEYVKGSASTLYGGGAIGGIVNLVSKTPRKPEILLHESLSSIGVRDFNAFFSKNFGKFGVTTLASLHMHKPYDVDKDGYSDMPDVLKIQFSPKLYFYPSDKSEIYFGITVADDKRMGGDMDLIKNQNADSVHFYYDSQISKRITSQFLAQHTFKKDHTLKLKNSVSSFDRFIQIRINPNGDFTTFSGNESSTFSELNYNLNKPKHNLNLGLNVYSETFTEEEKDTTALRNQEVITYGAYLNYLWDINKVIALETGFRADQASAKSKISSNPGELFLLPRISSLFKLSRQFTVRLGGGMGYRMPTIFNEESEPYGFSGIEAMDYANVKAERSYGGNFDFKYQSTFGTENVLLTFNQVFFYNLIDNPILLNADSIGVLNYSNDGDFLTSNGLESQIKLAVWKFTLLVGYTYTDVYIQNDDASKSYLTQTPKHSLKGNLLFIDEKKWRIGWDYEYKSEQLLSSGLQTPYLFTTGIFGERSFGGTSFFVNFENITDKRQTRYGSLRSGVDGTTQFTEVWAPLDGFFFNFGMKIML